MVDPDERDALSSLKLDQLDLRHIDPADLEETPSSNSLFTILLLGVIGIVLWLPRSQYYTLLGSNNFGFFVLASVGVAAGLSLGRLWWARLEKLANELPTVRPPKPVGPPSPLRRFVTLLLGVGLTLMVLVFFPAWGVLEPHNTGGFWYLAAILGVIAGITLSRWLIMQAEAAKPVERRSAPIIWPPWFKWVTLAGLLLLSLIASLSETLWPEGGHELRFIFGGIAFFVGIAGAIWLARRFDETTEKLQKEAAKKRVASQPSPEILAATSSGASQMRTRR